MELIDRLQQHMKVLCLECGPRHCGSPGEKMAADYIEAQFRELGYTVVREMFPTFGWELNQFSLVNVTQGREVPCATASYFSPSAEVEDQFLWITSDDLMHLETLPLQGRLCFVEAFTKTNANALSEQLEALGAAGAVFTNNMRYPSTKAPRSTNLSRMGVAAVGQDGALDIASHRNDVYRLTINARRFDHMSCNVIARREGPDKKGVFGAHYDTAPGVQGASDNATGTAILIELARLTRDLYPDYSFDFCAFSAEEYLDDSDHLDEIGSCPPGSKDYVRRHKDEDIRWYMNADNYGSNISENWLGIAHKEKLPPIQFACRKIGDMKPIGDCGAFVVNGIPALWPGDGPAFRIVHTVQDTLDLISYERMEQGTKTILDLVSQIAK